LERALGLLLDDSDKLLQASTGKNGYIVASLDLEREVIS
jgi:hypothetical protein